MPPTNPPACLTGIPTELRLHILSLLFWPFNTSGMWRTFYLYNNVYHADSGSYLIFISKSTFSSHFGIMATRGKLYNEALEVLYAETPITVAPMGAKHPSNGPWGAWVGLPGDMGIWRYVRHLRLDIQLEHGKKNRAAVLQRIENFAHALGYGGYLKDFEIHFRTAEDEGWPTWFDEVLQALTCLKVRGEVRIMVAGDVGGFADGDEELDLVCEQLKQRITR